MPTGTGALTVWGDDAGTVVALAARVRATFDGMKDAATAAMVDFDDRDLVRLAEGAGFRDIHRRTHVDVDADASTRPVDLRALLDGAPNPVAPTLRDGIDAARSPAERHRFLDHLGRAAAGDHVRRSAAACLTARKADAG